VAQFLFLLILLLPGTASASVRIVSAAPAGPAVEGQVVDIVVETSAPVDGARLTFPDLQGSFGASLCALRGGPGSRRVVLPYRPAWAGAHSLLVSVSSGTCGLAPQTDWRLVEFEAAPAVAAATASAPGCAGADAAPIPRSMQAARLAVVCLVNAERAARGLPALAPDERLRRVASRSAHRPARRGRRGEQRAVTPGSAPSAVVTAWLANEAHARDLLDPAVRRLGVAVVARFPEPLRRPETTYVVELG
jgi:hypothetical protein